MLIYVLFVCVLLFIKCNNIGNRFMFGFVGIFVFVFVIGLVIGFVSIIGVEFISIVGVMLFLVVGNYINKFNGWFNSKNRCKYFSEFKYKFIFNVVVFYKWWCISKWSVS